MQSPLDPAAPSSPAASRPAAPSLPRRESIATLVDAERALIAARRVVAGVAADAPTVGLALSGGGVRSATFSLGLLRGMAQCGQLMRVDYLSTVSGGGYIGAMFGRLVTLVGIAQAQALLAADGSVVLAWLRRNGRYLTPGGSRDVGIAVVTYLRAFLAIHAEFIAVSVPFALLVIAPHLWQVSTSAPFDAAQWQPWYTLWWPMAAVLWCLGAPGLMAGYWVARDTGNPGARHVLPPWRDVVFVLLVLGALAAIWLMTRPPLPSLGAALTAPALVLVVLTSAAGGLTVSQLWLAATPQTRSLAVAQVRHFTTFALRTLGIVTVAGFAFGALDLLSWWLLVELQSGQRWVWSGIGVGGAVVLLLRALAQPLLQLSQRAQPGTARGWGPAALNAAGIFGMVALLSAWIVGVQWMVFAPAPAAALTDYSPAVRAGLMLGVCVVWTLLTAGNAQMANASSLHSFYRARLNRAYLAVGNPRRGIAVATDEPAHDVTEVVNGDDVGLASYQPEAQGGPVHLVNACLNQTIDDASGLYNADRKGTLVTATARGFEIGPDTWVPRVDSIAADDASVALAGAAAGKSRPRSAAGPSIEGSDAGTLGRWIAVSGAAAAPGAGAYTSRGWALMLYFLGVRLGHWMAAPMAPEAPGKADRLRGWRRLTWRYAIKPAMLWSEGTATYFGIARPWWYLSDGGHFDNTGVYPLLKRQLDFIVLSDASSDAAYEFADLENLVRKARIDLGAEIEFYTAAEATDLFHLPGPQLTVLSPEDLTNNHSARGVLLARVRYRADPAAPDAPRREGTLLIIKPNLHDALDVDLLAYAQRKLAFPHEGTADQSFDEAQWESYHRLGEDFGRRLHTHWLAQVPGWQLMPPRALGGTTAGAGAQRRLIPHPLKVAARLGRADRLDGKERRATEPLWRRAPKAAAIGATVGLTASGTLALSAYQVQDQFQKAREAQRAEVKTLFTQVSQALSNYDPKCPKISAATVTPFLVLNAVKQTGSLSPIEADGVTRMTGRVQQGCRGFIAEQAPRLLKATPNEGDASGGDLNKLITQNMVQQAAQNVVQKKAGGGSCTPPTEPELTSHVQLCTVLESGNERSDALNYWFPVVAVQKNFGDWLQTWREPEPPPEARACGNAAVLRDAAVRLCGPQVELLPADPALAGLTDEQRCAPGDSFFKHYEGNLSTTPRDNVCLRAALLTLRTQVYDEPSRHRANALLDDLQSRSGEVFIAAPVQDVVQNSLLRQTREPVPWPQPTVVLHRPDTQHPEDRRCAAALQAFVACRWKRPDGMPSEPWLRTLPPSVRERDRVVELWLPKEER